MCGSSGFLSDSNFIRLSADTNNVLLVFSVFCIFSSAFNIASCSAWLFEHPPFNLHFVVSGWVLFVYISNPDPTTCSVLLLSVYIFMVCLLSSCPSIILTAYAGLVQCFTSFSRSIWFQFPFIHSEYFAVSSIFMLIGIIPILHTVLHLTPCGRPLLF